jgi:molecular chaperone GrpE
VGGGKRRAAETLGAEREDTAAQASPAPAEDVDWRDLALRLQAEMENFRKRQRRLAESEVTSEQERLLRGVLSVADNLERALASSAAGADGGLRQGVELTYNALLQWLGRQGVERMHSRGRPFDPALHEAISTVPCDVHGAAPQTVLEVAEEGYTLQSRLLRPAKVVVAV